MYHHVITPSATASTATLAEICGAFSYALDLTEGQPLGHSLRACWIATELARELGLAPADVRTVYYATLLKDLGCSSNSARVAQVFLGDDRALKHDFKLLDPDPQAFADFVCSSVGRDAAASARDDAIGVILGDAPAILGEFMDTRCNRGAAIARRLRFDDAVATAILHLDEHWDGYGLPLGLGGEAIALPARIALLAQVADVFFTAHGADAARAQVAARRGSWFDPRLVDAFLAGARRPGYWAALDAPDLELRVLAAAPEHDEVTVDERWLDDIAAAFGAVIDAKSPYTAGHSQRVARIADAVAADLALTAAQRRTVHRAALLHDLGKLGVSSRILEKPGRLDADEWVAMRHHAVLTADILSRVPPLRDLALLAAAHHERLDGAGYPLALGADTIAIETRVITVADIFDALTADRPYRAALPVDRALAILHDDCGTAIDPACLTALERALATGALSVA